jgi:tetraacyldisaccharide 4'-kinase
LLSAALRPFSGLYGKALEARARLYRSGALPSRGVPVPVVSVGNLTFGGTGKTPFVEHLARRLKFEGRRPAVVSRGYGRRTRGVVVVSDGAGPLVDAEEGGDEPVAIARRAPGVAVVVGERRADAAETAVRRGADVVLLDDGYQHLALRRDVDLLLLDASDPFGGGRLPPGGRLREPLSAIGRADAVVFTRVERAAPPRDALAEVARRNRDAPVFTARIRAEGLRDESGSPVPATALSTRRFLAVCGIAGPESFRRSLAELALFPDELLAFPDHHRYGDRDLRAIRRAADRTGSAWLVTTEKDAVKLEGRTTLPVVTLRLEVIVEEAGFFPFLLAEMSGAPSETSRRLSAPTS